MPGGPGADGPVDLDTTLYLPATTPAPAVLVAHGFGGSKASVDTDARDLADRGFVVLAWSARGFGASGGQIALNSPDYEVADARALVDWLAARPEVVQDGPGDPRVGVTGGSYGGALSLLLAGYDRRVDALAPVITWNDLGQALFPNAAAAPAAPPADTPARGAFAPGRGVQARLGRDLLLPAGSRRARRAERPRGRGGSEGGRRAARPAARRRHPAPRTGPTPTGPAARRRAAGPAAASPRRSAPPTPRRPPPAGSPPPPPSCCAARPRPRSPTGSPRRRCSCRASRTRCSDSTRPTPTPARSPRPAAPVKVALVRRRPRRRRAGPAGPRRRSASGSTSTSPATATTRAPASATPSRAGCVRAANTPTEPHRRGAGVPGPRRQPRGGHAAARAGGRPAGRAEPAGRQPGRDHLAARARRRAGQRRRPGHRVHRRAARPVRAVPHRARRPHRCWSPARRGSTSRSPGCPASRRRRTRRCCSRRSTRSPRTALRTLLGSAVAPIRVPVPADGTPRRGHRHAARAWSRPIEAGNRLMVSVSTTDQGYAGTTEPAVWRIGLVGPGGGAHRAGGARRGRHGQHRAARSRRSGIGVVLALALLALAVVGRLRPRRRRAPTAGPPTTRPRHAAAAGDPRPRQDLPGRVQRGERRVVRRRARHGARACSGPTAPGKTTVLRMLMGLIRPTAGTIRAFGEPVGAGRAGAGPDRGVRRGARASCRTCPARTTCGCTGPPPAGRPRRRTSTRRWRSPGSATSVRAPGRHLQPGHAAAAGDRPGHARAAGAAGARRADERARPAADPRHARGAAALRRRPGARCWCPATCSPRWSRPARTSS